MTYDYDTILYNAVSDIIIMKAARIIKPREALQVQDLETPKPKSSQVLVKVLSSSICHSDIHLWAGRYEGPGDNF
jgi:alcohol dehydrogenase, propanol-preferring